MKGKYDDMINMPHHVSRGRAHMPVSDRAAQFAPFAALTGYDKTIDEAGRLTDKKIELDEAQKSIINEKLQEVIGNIQLQPPVCVTYFIPDERKTGGSYCTIHERLKKVDEFKRLLIMNDGSRIPIDDIVEFENRE